MNRKWFFSLNCRFEFNQQKNYQEEDQENAFRLIWLALVLWCRSSFFQCSSSVHFWCIGRWWWWFFSPSPLKVVFDTNNHLIIQSLSARCFLIFNFFIIIARIGKGLHSQPTRMMTNKMWRLIMVNLWILVNDLIHFHVSRVSSTHRRRRCNGGKVQNSIDMQKVSTVQRENQFSTSFFLLVS